MKLGVSRTGVSDAGLSPIVTVLTELGKKLRKHSPAINEDDNAPLSSEIQLRLQKELEELLGKDGKVEDWVNPLLGMRSMIFFIHIWT